MYWSILGLLITCSNKRYKLDRPFTSASTLVDGVLETCSSRILMRASTQVRETTESAQK